MEEVWDRVHGRSMLPAFRQAAELDPQLIRDFAHIYAITSSEEKQLFRARREAAEVARLGGFWAPQWLRAAVCRHPNSIWHLILPPSAGQLDQTLGSGSDNR